jgi:exopolysaccharide biosynthesis polyprenyl glycosylphosphotransferase
MQARRFRIDALFAHKLLLAASDTVSLVSAFNVSFTLRNYWFAWRGGVYEPNIRHAVFLAGLIALILGFFRHHYLYRRPAYRLSVEHLELLTKAWISFVGIFIAIAFFLRIQLFIEHRITMFLFLAVGWVFLYLGRFIGAPWLARLLSLDSRFPYRVLCITSPEEAARVAEFISHDQATFSSVAGYLGEEPATPPPAETPPRLGDVKDLDAVLDRNPIHEVFIWMPKPDWDRITAIVDRLARERIRIRLATDHFGALRDRVPFLPETDYGYIFVNESPLRTIEGAFKRVFDFLAASLGLILLSPLFLALGLLIRLDSPGPIFFMQKRCGLGGRTFDVFKFRTMRANTEDHHREAVKRLVNEDHEFMKRETGRSDFFKVTNDAMVTAVGRFLRRTSLDELPQLINVWRGDMSLIGPRPLPLYEVELLAPWQRSRHAMRPGITGFWQVHGRSAVSHKDTMLMDLFYIMNWSFSLDLHILTRTVFVMLTGKGGW